MGRRFRDSFIANKVFLKVGNIIEAFSVNSLLGI
jgi:hypothetical protein